MSSPDAVPGVLIRDAVAVVGAEGQLQPVNDAMRQWAANVADHLDQLPLEADQRKVLEHGGTATASIDDAICELWLAADGDTRWLFVRDVTDRERHLVAALTAARCRHLGSEAATLAHDLNNQFNAVLALLASLSYIVEQDSDRETIAELERGTKVGMRMVTSLARLLVDQTRHREPVAGAELLEDALSMVKKSLALQSIEVATEMADSLPKLRAPYVEAVQSLMHGLVAVQLGKPQKVTCTADLVTASIGGGRERDFVALSCRGDAMSAEVVGRIQEIVASGGNKWLEVRNHSDDFESLANAVFLQRRLGGDLRVAVDGCDCRLEYLWPAVR